MRGLPRQVRGARWALRHRLQRRFLPRVPTGWITGPPDFVGIGAQRSGTSWWYGLICEHPDVHPARGKELHFFDRYGARPFSDEDTKAYHRLLPRPPGAITGEWTPRYMLDYWAPALLERAAPEARLLMLLRDPLDRYRSGIGHESRVLARELKRANSAHLLGMIAQDALARSLYSSQVSRVLSRFERSQLLVLQYERCVEDPAHELRRTYHFLGLDPQYLPEIPARTAQQRPPATELPAQVVEAACQAIAEDAAELVRLVPEIDLELWPSSRTAPLRVGRTQRFDRPDQSREGVALTSGAD